MARSFKVAVVGADGLVGREVVAVLAERGFPASEVVALAAGDGAGERIELGEEELTVRHADAEAFTGVDIALLSAGAEASRRLAPLATGAGAVVVDDSSAWRLDPDVPLVVPEVNAADLAGHGRKGIVAIPAAPCLPLLVALAPLHREAALRRVVVSTYEAASGEGRRGMDELDTQLRALFTQGEAAAEVFPKRLAFNCLPQVGAFRADRTTQQERALLEESRKILAAPALGLCATCVRVPVFNGCAATVVAEFERPMNAETARRILREAPGVVLTDEPLDGVYPTPADSEGTDATLVGRVRDDPSAPHALALWCVADNLRKGAATSLVEVAEILARDHL